MLSVCANPDCGILFDYREGRFFRFHKDHALGENPPNTHCVQHYWLCGKCSELYTLGYVKNRGVVMACRQDVPGSSEQLRFVAVA
jgi:hypothetical protein